MPIDIAVLATTVVSSFLLPYVKEGAKKIGEAVRDKVGETAAGHVVEIAEKVWNKVRSVFTGDDEKAAMTLLEKRPEVGKPAVEAILKEKLEKDEELAKQLDEMVNSRVPGGVSTGAQIMNASGIVGILDARGQIISHVNTVKQAGVMIGRDEPETAPMPRPSHDAATDESK